MGIVRVFRNDGRITEHEIAPDGKVVFDEPVRVGEIVESSVVTPILDRPAENRKQRRAAASRSKGE